jgi:hypothetical protein
MKLLMKTPIGTLIGIRENIGDNKMPQNRYDFFMELFNFVLFEVAIIFIISIIGSSICILR